MFRRLVAVLFLCALFPFPVHSILSLKCANLTIRTAKEQDLLHVCAGYNVASNSLVVMKNHFGGEYYDSFVSLKGKLVVFNTDLVRLVIPHILVDLPKSEDIVLSIQKNDYLSHLEFAPGLSLMKQNYSIVVRGNRRLSRKSILQLRERLPSHQYSSLHNNPYNQFVYIQDPGECYAGNPDDDIINLGGFETFLDSLEGCAYILGDLKLLGGASGKWPKGLREVRGCLRIEDTKLTDFSFLENLALPQGLCKGKHSLKNNEFLYKIPESIKRDTNWEIMGNGESICNENGYRDTVFGRRCKKRYIEATKPNCPLPITEAENLLKTKKIEGRTPCLIVDQPIYINSSHTQINYEVTNEIRHVKAPIVLANTSLRDFSFFTNLHTIESTTNTSEPLLEIVGNKNLEHFNMPSLLSVRVKENNDSILIRIRDNGKYLLPFHQHKRLIEIVGRERLDVDFSTDLADNNWELLCVVHSFTMAVIGSVILVLFTLKVRKIRKQDQIANALVKDDALALASRKNPWKMTIRLWLRRKLGLAGEEEEED